MKTQNPILKTLIICLFACCFVQGASAKAAFVKATNTEAYLWTEEGTRFSWSGGVKNSYCSGYGTVQFYDYYGNGNGKYVGSLVYGNAEGYGVMYGSNGYRIYDGYWKNNFKHGAGTSYTTKGHVEFKGEFENGQLKDIDELNSLAYTMGKAIMNEVFDGGLRLSTRNVKLTDDEWYVKIMFYGNIITTNYYEMTLTMKGLSGGKSPLIDFIDYNENAETYLGLVVAVNVAKIISDVFDK